MPRENSNVRLLSILVDKGRSLGGRQVGCQWMLISVHVHLILQIGQHGEVELMHNS